MRSSGKYRHIFFDLDKTIWDFEKNSFELLNELFEKHRLKEFGIPGFWKFHETYTLINLELWNRYRSGQIEKTEVSINRFYNTLMEFGCDNLQLARDIASDYVTLSPLKKNLIPGSREVLDYLGQKYILHILTNGFSEVQLRKIEVNELTGYFTNIITSEQAGSMKPDPGIFNFAFLKSGASPTDSLMIGDDIEVDMMGAMKAGMDQMYLNLENRAHDYIFTYEIKSFEEVFDIL